MSSTLICSHRSMVVECQIRIMLMDAPTNGKAKRRECLILLQSSHLISSHNIYSSVALSYQPSTMLGHICCRLGRFSPSLSSLLDFVSVSLICPSFPFRNHDVDSTPDASRRRLPPCSLAHCLRSRGRSRAKKVLTPGLDI